ncbi:MAG TPA: HAD family phosphatase [Candidatus Bathyarchaeia archaeon]|nr:HAD family phosphatase [Candidatus Bathyarchaeia archaeon]
MSAIDTLKSLIESSDAAIFDFDNVLVDSEPYHYEAYARVFARHGHTIDRDEYWLEWTSRGGGAESEIRRYNLRLDANAMRAEKDPIYAEYCRSGAIKTFPDSAAVIEALRTAGLTLAIASGSFEADIRAILRGSGLERHFSVIIGKDNIERYKPHPDTYLVAAERLGIEPARCLAIEDAEKGVRSAREAGMRVILIETSITKDLGLGGADLKIASLAELRRLLAAVVDSTGRNGRVT